MVKKKIKPSFLVKTKRRTALTDVPQKLGDTKKIVFFLIKFTIIFLVLTIIIENADLSFLTQFIASLVAPVLGLTNTANIIGVGGLNFLITNSCTGLVSASILASVIFALKKPSLLKKAGLFTAGLVLLLIINIPRIMLVLFAAQIGFDSELVHEITWFLMSALILIIWYYGTKRILKKEEFSELI
ncbi:MAG: hypothetical protein WCW13_06670 [archaeon]|jgi:exosortase/archaeosortase family protein